MAAGNEQIDSANVSLSQLMQTAAATVAPLLSSAQQIIWKTAQTNGVNGVPTQFRYVPNVTPAQAYALLVSVSRHRTNATALLNVLQQQQLNSILQTENRNATAMFANDGTILPIPAQLPLAGSSQSTPSGQ
jgi:hypothetical protein